MTAPVIRVPTLVIPYWQPEQVFQHTENLKEIDRYLTNFGGASHFEDLFGHGYDPLGGYGEPTVFPSSLTWSDGAWLGTITSSTSREIDYGYGDVGSAGPYSYTLLYQEVSQQDWLLFQHYANSPSLSESSVESQAKHSADGALAFMDVSSYTETQSSVISLETGYRGSTAFHTTLTIAADSTQTTTPALNIKSGLTTIFGVSPNGDIGGASPSTNYLIKWNGSTWVAATAPSAPPTGAAGGDLTGTYPNPTLATSGVTAATYGSATQVAQVVVDAKGRLTSASNVTIQDAWTDVVKAADESVTTSTAVQNDDHLFFTAVSGASYEIELLLVYASPVGGGTPDLKLDLGEDSTARGVFTSSGFDVSDAAALTSILDNQTATLTYGTATGKRTLRIFGSHQGAGGTFRLRWAQNTSDANATTVYTGSILRYRRIV